MMFPTFLRLTLTGGMICIAASIIGMVCPSDEGQETAYGFLTVGAFIFFVGIMAGIWS